MEGYTSSPSRTAARPSNFISQDPFTQAHLFERVVMTRWHKAYFNFESCLTGDRDLQDGGK